MINWFLYSWRHNCSNIISLFLSLQRRVQSLVAMVGIMWQNWNLRCFFSVCTEWFYVEALRAVFVGIFFWSTDWGFVLMWWWVFKLYFAILAPRCHFHRCLTFPSWFRMSCFLFWRLCGSWLRCSLNHKRFVRTDSPGEKWACCSGSSSSIGGFHLLRYFINLNVSSLLFFSILIYFNNVIIVNDYLVSSTSWICYSCL